MEHRSVDFKEETVKAALRALPLGGLRIFSSIGSTNDAALEWARGDAADMSVVLADEQTAGRGRAGRQWHTPAGKALALSVILRGGDSQPPSGRLTGLGALAVIEACDSLGVQASIKWPNDVLWAGRKTAGTLVEAIWSGERLRAAVIGIGINILRGSAPALGAAFYPATCLEEALGKSINRLEVLRAVLSSIVAWRPLVHTPRFLRTWESHLAFMGEEVTLILDGGAAVTGEVLGLEQDGGLRLKGPTGVLTASVGEIHLQPGNDRIR